MRGTADKGVIYLNTTGREAAKHKEEMLFRRAKTQENALKRANSAAQQNKVL